MNNIILQVSLYDADTKKTESLFCNLTGQPDLSRIYNLLRKYFGDELRYWFTLTLHYAPYSLNSTLKFQNEVVSAFLDRQDITVYDRSHIFTQGFPASDGLLQDISLNSNYKRINF